MKNYHKEGDRDRERQRKTGLVALCPTPTTGGGETVRTIKATRVLVDASVLLCEFEQAALSEKVPYSSNKSKEVRQ